ncbi:MAGa7180 family putative nuclease [Mycoplasma sp. 'Moose RK']|uniref:MAGa7180 family putative nuclease n=1 Tax=Mycoplasma sp. 'Moose RK' TaxID=2780095 RepID=UPI0018C29D29|nr:YqaJ viral recombinase family protein [Mycoplasma sp. 'Moose RK']MBG0730920.1 YqaJ viral recombinase family protein [Mycoplasma sp. 'Moose RK']
MYKDRKFYHKKDYFIDFEKQVLVLEKSFHEKLLAKKFAFNTGFKKIGGSLIGEVLGLDNFSSPFRAFVKIAKLDMPILDTKYIDAGVAIEPLVIAAIFEKTGFEIETFPPEKYNYDYFKEDPILGGIPDGFIKKTNTIIEVKTTGIKNLEKWGKKGENLPQKYLKQAQLYSFLKKAKNFAIVATFLEDSDYENPQNFPIRKRPIRTYAFKVNEEQVLDDIQKIKKWYENFTQLGISPRFDPILDAKILEYLSCENQEEWKNLYENWIFQQQK